MQFFSCQHKVLATPASGSYVLHGNNVCTLKSQKKSQEKPKQFWRGLQETLRCDMSKIALLTKGNLFKYNLA